MSERIPRKPGQPAKSDKHSDLYTDEDPKDTIHGLKFATTEDAEASVRKIKSSGRSHAHKIQAAIAMEQRAKVMGKADAAAVYRSFINSMKEKTKEMREDWSNKYKKSIDCNNPKGFSQKAHCQARKLRSMGEKTKSKPINEARVDKHEVSGKVVVDGHVFSDAGKSGRSTYGRYSNRKDSFSTISDAKKWVKTQPKKSPEEIDRVHKKHAEFEKSMNEDFGIAKALSPIIHRKSYMQAKKTLSDVLKRKQNSGKDKLYYAARISQSYPGVDAKKLAAMHEDVPINVASTGKIAGIGVGPQGEPGVPLRNKKKVMPFAMFVRKTKQ